MPLILSASPAMGALLPCACSTMRTIPERTVSSPTRRVLYVKLPLRLTLPPMTSSPGCLSTGMLSPLSMDSSTLVVPSIISPSTGMRSPGRTRMISPTTSSSTSTCFSLPSFATTHAVSGASPMSFAMASPVRDFARCSRYLPNMTRVMITPADSKYSPSCII